TDRRDRRLPIPAVPSEHRVCAHGDGGDDPGRVRNRDICDFRLPPRPGARDRRPAPAGISVHFPRNRRARRDPDVSDGLVGWAWVATEAGARFRRAGGAWAPPGPAIRSLRRSTESSFAEFVLRGLYVHLQRCPESTAN